MMAVWQTSLRSAIYQVTENMAINAAGGAGGWSWSFGSLPDWIQLVLALVGVGVSISVGTYVSIGSTLNILKDRFPEPDKDDPVRFVTMLCDQVWDCTNRITTVFAQRLREPPGDIAAMRILVRHLREDLSIPINFIEQMRAHPPGDWHGADIFKAFTNWSAQVAAMAKQLDDLHQAITYPLLREPVDKHRDAMLVYQYLTEQAFLDRRIDDLSGRAYEFCAVARKLLKKAKKKAGKKEADDEDRDCPCCKHPPEHHRYAVRNPLQPIILPAPPVPPPPPAPPPPAPTPTVCRCAAPRACQCWRACQCACQCVPAPVAKMTG